jgi:hypothetical protein
MSGMVIRYKATKTDKLVVALIVSVAVSFVSVLAGLPITVALVIGTVGTIFSLCFFLKSSNRCGICDHEFNASSLAQNIGEANSHSKTSKWICQDCRQIALTSGQRTKK